jgi:hypothetical protein
VKYYYVLSNCRSCAPITHLYGQAGSAPALWEVLVPPRAPACGPNPLRSPLFPRHLRSCRRLLHCVDFPGVGPGIHFKGRDRHQHLGPLAEERHPQHLLEAPKTSELTGVPFRQLTSVNIPSSRAFVYVTRMVRGPL